MSFTPFEEKMRGAGLTPAQIERFRVDYERLAAGEKGMLPESTIQPVERLPRLEDLPESHDLQDQVIIIKLNGGLGTTMGLAGPKALLPVKNGMNFLDVVARQVLHLREKHGTQLPLLLMNSFNTTADSVQALEKYPELKKQPVPLEFLQSKVPKVRVDNLQPAEYPPNPNLEWCPPGHGEIYACLKGGDLLGRLVEKGYRYAFISNIDNLGANFDPRILGWLAREGLDFAMEVTRRLPVDKKGGHLARAANGRLLLREVAQCPSDDLAHFQDIERHRYFNTNNLWLNLVSLSKLAKAPTLPLIVNKKTVDPADKSTFPVYQLESAMGAAIQVFERTQALEVDRARFAPVKNFGDLLTLSSDVYELTDCFELKRVAETVPRVELDIAGWDHFRETFEMIPSLRECRSLKLSGPHRFKKQTALRGDVVLEHAGPEPREV